MSARLVIDDSIFREDFGVRPFRVRHRLCGHPFFSAERIESLGQRLAVDRVEKNAGGNWMVLKNVESDPDFAGLLDACLDDIGEEMSGREAFLFVSAPSSITPYHIDPEHNFLLQISGTKTVHLFDGDDRSVLTDEELERFYTGGGRNLVFREELQRRARTYVLRPGDGLYFPVTHPHWVKNGPERSVSFSVTFRTPETEARDRLYKMNAKLRSLGVPVAAPGAIPAFDRAKLLAFEAARAAKRLFTGTAAAASP